jgi:outer membrane protein OmpA-like peptidoglycan-associated protein
MKASLLIGGIGLALATTPVHARETTKEGHIGVGSGMVVGALAGGPVGMVIGAGLGAWIGEKFHDGRELPGVAAERDAAIGQLDDARIELVSTRNSLVRTQGYARDLEQSLNARDAEMARLEEARAPELGRGLEFDVLFRTGESTLPADVQQRLNELAAVIATSPQLSVQLDGHADPRGGDDYNRTLSEARVQAVRAALVASGVEASHIDSAAHGESDSLAKDGDLDAYALERRVRIRLGIATSAGADEPTQSATAGTESAPAATESATTATTATVAGPK